MNNLLTKKGVKDEIQPSEILEKKLENPLPDLSEDERIYFNVTYETRYFAKYVHCRFDPEKKLWFTGCKNANLKALVRLYGVNNITSNKAIKLLQNELDVAK